MTGDWRDDSLFSSSCGSFIPGARFGEGTVRATARGEFCCYYCGKVFETDSACEQHEKSKHEQLSETRVKYCTVDPSCKKAFRDEVARSQHVAAAHPESLDDYQKSVGLDTMYCDICCKDYDDFSSYVQHKQSHINGSIKLKLKGKVEPYTKTSSDLDSKPTPQWCCTLCEPKKHFAKLIGYNAHLTKVHNIYVNENPCKHCNKIFVQKSDLQKHYVHGCQEKRLGKHVCPDCRTEFSTIEKYTIHWHATHNPDIFRCSLCKKPFEAKSACVQHENSHRPDDADRFVFKCAEGYCTQSFEKRAEWYNHRISVHGRRTDLRMCPHCEGEFQQDSIIRHQTFCKNRMKSEAGTNFRPFKGKLISQSYQSSRAKSPAFGSRPKIKHERSRSRSNHRHHSSSSSRSRSRSSSSSSSRSSSPSSSRSPRSRLQNAAKKSLTPFKPLIKRESASLSSEVFNGSSAKKLNIMEKPKTKMTYSSTLSGSQPMQNRDVTNSDKQARIRLANQGGISGNAPGRVPFHPVVKLEPDEPVTCVFGSTQGTKSTPCTISTPSTQSTISTPSTESTKNTQSTNCTPSAAEYSPNQPQAVPIHLKYELQPPPDVQLTRGIPNVYPAPEITPVVPNVYPAPEIRSVVPNMCQAPEITPALPYVYQAPESKPVVPNVYPAATEFITSEEITLMSGSVTPDVVPAGGSIGVFPSTGTTYTWQPPLPVETSSQPANIPDVEMIQPKQEYIMPDEIQHTSLQKSNCNTASTYINNNNTFGDQQSPQPENLSPQQLHFEEYDDITGPVTGMQCGECNRKFTQLPAFIRHMSKHNSNTVVNAEHIY